MTEPETKMSVCPRDNCAWIRIEGRADYHHSECFKQLVRNLQEQGCTRFYLELTKCNLMDSTFAGTMSMLGREFEAARGTRNEPSLCLLNASQRVHDTLDNLGIAELFPRLDQDDPGTCDFQPVDPPPERPDQEQLRRAMLDAHKELARANPANFKKFQDVIKFLEAEGAQKEERT